MASSLEESRLSFKDMFDLVVACLEHLC